MGSAICPCGPGSRWFLCKALTAMTTHRPSVRVSSVALWRHCPSLFSVFIVDIDVSCILAIVKSLAPIEEYMQCADPWHWWNQIRGLCGHHSKLGILLEVPENLPSLQMIHRWLGEPVKALILPISVFQTNKRGFPTLSKAHQDLLLLFFRHNVQVNFWQFQYSA